jgi:hypothetical protein
MRNPGERLRDILPVQRPGIEACHRTVAAETGTRQAQNQEIASQAEKAWPQEERR